MSKALKYLSLFSGIGGFELGIQRASNNEHAHIGEESEQEERTSGRKRSSDQQEVLLHHRNRTTPLCVGYSEIDKYAIKVYERQFNGKMFEGSSERGEQANSQADKGQGFQPTQGQDIRTEAGQSGRDIRNEPDKRQFNSGGHTNYGDATKINAADLPDFDLLVGGFPCQAFSVAGKRQGFNDTRGTLFFDIARILAEKRPRHLVLENVKGLLSHDGGKTFQTILGVLSDLGYRVEWQVLNSKDFGVPQNRERVFFVGHLRDECGGEVFPITGTDQKDTRIVGQDVAYAIDANYHKGTNTLEKSRRSIVQINQPKHSNDRVYSDEGLSPTLNTMQGGNRQPFITNPKMNNYKPDYEKSVAITATSYKEPPVVNAIRRLTPTECLRLQGFPDDWCDIGSDGVAISDSQKYKMAGNAVTVNVVHAVIGSLYSNCLTQLKEDVR